MPIRINLLAEAQELEQQRRRDPVKRVILAGIVLTVMMLAWSSSLLAKTIFTRSAVESLEAEISSQEKEHKSILESRQRLIEGRQRLSALQQLTTNRFLVGSLLNSLQKTTLDDVQLVRLKVDQTYDVTPEVKPRGGRGTAKPATSVEKVVITLTARYSSPTPGEGVSRYQTLLSEEPYLSSLLGRTNGFRLLSISPWQSGMDGSPFVLMTLEGKLPEKTR